MWESQFQEAHAHRQDLMREAERSAIVRKIRASHQNRPGVRRQVMVWFGSRLVAWGERLQGCRECWDPEGIERMSSVQHQAQ